MDIDLNLYQSILLLLNTKISDINLCKYILFIKQKIENKEALDYHIERWETISSKYFRSFETDKYNQREIYSYSIDEIYYVYKEDKSLDFYNETNISYQVRDLLLDILDIPYYLNKNMNILNNEYKEYRLTKDNDYSNLSKKIMNLMKGNGYHSNLDYYSKMS